MANQQQHGRRPVPGEDTPWYKQFWPWFIIALPASVVVASFYTLYLAISNPDGLVLTEDEYQRVRSGLKAQQVEQQKSEDTAKPDSEPD